MTKTLKIYQEAHPMNPRENDNLGVMAYKHRKYTLGEEEISDPIEWLEEKLGLQPKYEYTNERLEELEARFFDEYIALPLYLYDHSSITMKTTPFDCRWDSSKVGYIYASKAKVREEYSWKVITTKRRKLIEKYLIGEVETFDQYIRGDIYGFEVEDEDGNYVDSCWGFFGTDWENNGIKHHIEEELWPQLENIEIN